MMLLDYSERYVLSCFLLRPTLLGSVDLSVDEILDPKCAKFYGALTTLDADGLPFDAGVAAHVLEEDVDTDWFCEVMDFAPHTQALDYHVQNIKRHAAEREVKKAAAEIYHGGGSGQDLLELAEEKLGKLDKQDDGPIHESVAIEKLKVELRDGVDMLETGYPDIDRYLAVRRGELITIGGIPNHGKSLLVGWLVTQYLAKGERVLWVTTETSAHQVEQRLAAVKAEISTRKIDKSMPSRLRQAYLDALESHRGRSLWFWSEACESARVCGEIRLRRRRDNVSVVVVDHLNELVDERSRGSGRREMVEGIWLDLRQACRGRGGPLATLLVVSQLNRAYAQRASGRPSMSDLRETGVGGQMSQIVVIVHRPNKDSNDDEKQDNVLDAAVEKNKDGPTGLIPFRFDAVNGHLLGPMTLRRDGGSMSAPQTTRKQGSLDVPKHWTEGDE